MLLSNLILWLNKKIPQEWFELIVWKIWWVL